MDMEPVGNREKMLLAILVLMFGMVIFLSFYSEEKMGAVRNDSVCFPLNYTVVVITSPGAEPITYSNGTFHTPEIITYGQKLMKFDSLFCNDPEPLECTCSQQSYAIILGYYHLLDAYTLDLLGCRCTYHGNTTDCFLMYSPRT